jgi:hypothetical protein
VTLVAFLEKVETREVWCSGHFKEKHLNVCGILERDSEINELRLLRYVSQVSAFKAT